MNRLWLQGIGFGCVVFFLAGCGSTGVTTRTYMMDKERVDQDMKTEGQNYGYVFGTPAPADRSKYKKTRRIYVMEFTREPEKKDDGVIVIEKVKPRPRNQVKSAPVPERPSRSRDNTPDWAQPVEIPSFDEDMESAESMEEPAAGTTYTEYTVQKNDTLQKISKKFYDTYRKWQRIVDANPDVLKDPNKIKPGMKLRIPE